jgi:hypothetical protein
MPQQRQPKITVKDLMEAGLIRAGQPLRGTSRRRVDAEVSPTGGILIRGHEFPSLSAAAASINNSAVNGWVYWSVKFSGEWVKIDALREQLQKNS